MPFSSLPPELIHQVIDSTVPHSFHSMTYNDRQNTLCRLSLVSRQFLSIARPLLYQIVCIRDPQDIGMVPLGSEREKRLVQQLVLEMPSVQEKCREAEETIVQLSSLTSLTMRCPLDSGVEVDLTFIGSLLHLSNLHLSWNRWRITGPLILPSLKSLTLNVVDARSMSVLLDATTVPNLKEFALVDGYLPETLRYPSALRQLIPQLDCIYIDTSAWEDPSAKFLHSSASRTLIDCTAQELFQLPDALTSVVHLRIYTSFSRESVITSQLEDLNSSLEDFASFLDSISTTSLQSIYLDTSLHHLCSFPATLDNLVRICQGKNIEVVFETQADSFILDCYTSAEFLRRQRRSRREEEELQSR